MASLNFEDDSKPNRHAFHDTGMAVENLVLQATALGLAAHQMAGFDVEKARADLKIPSGYEPVAMIAVGYPGSSRPFPTGYANENCSHEAVGPFQSGRFPGSGEPPAVAVS